jgi:hypothetical protein
LDTNGDGKVTLDEAPRQGKMLVEFLLSQSGKKSFDPLTRQEFLRLNPSHAYDHAPTEPYENAVAAALSAGEVQPAPENCPACAMGLTADFVFKRLDVDGDRFVTVTEFMRSPGMRDETETQTKKQCPTGDAPWDIGHCCLIGHWCLVIGAWSLVLWGIRGASLFPLPSAAERESMSVIAWRA